MPTITKIETAIPAGIMPNLVLVRISTDEGQVGCGETYYTPHAIEALIHEHVESTVRLVIRSSVEADASAEGFVGPAAE